MSPRLSSAETAAPPADATPAARAGSGMPIGAAPDLAASACAAPRAGSEPRPAEGGRAAPAPVRGLVLSGGGARAAYQVGVLLALRELLHDQRPPATRLPPGALPTGIAPRPPGEAPRAAIPARLPFDVVSGTSAGAINATALACRADDFDAGLDVLARVWRDIHAHHVYRSDVAGVARTGAHWLAMFVIGWALRRRRFQRPRSLLDNSPLAGQLDALMDFPRLARNIDDGRLRALAVAASDYGSGEHYTFFQTAARIAPWSRTQRQARPARIGIGHLLASSAIPFIFPAAPLEVDGEPSWFGDGSIRQHAPMSPAIHLGADRLFVVGAASAGARGFVPEAVKARRGQYPTLAQVAGHALGSIFLDGLAMDVERLERINRTLALMPPARLAESPLRPVRVLVVAPSRPIDPIAARHVRSLPRPVRMLLGSVGATEARGAALASYLLFEPGFVRELMQLGHDDCMRKRDEVRAFFA
ncbi:patatin-like phospholipase family protein [Derxia gummosa]|uniref:Patatin-like phospholipase family protein n=1 Tax=Derxia gummosa DSM 723 TaxID=1121388 RepID=A0A9U5C4G1_9BURK|nr:patatin-like phospholipase family protein [Derxia gummosa]